MCSPSSTNHKRNTTGVIAVSSNAAREGLAELTYSAHFAWAVPSPEPNWVLSVWRYSCVKTALGDQQVTKTFRAMDPFRDTKFSKHHCNTSLAICDFPLLDGLDGLQPAEPKEWNYRLMMMMLLALRCCWRAQWGHKWFPSIIYV